MRIHVIRAVLRIILQDEERCRIPEWRMRDGLYRAAHGKIVVGHRRLWRRPARPRPRRVIVGQAELDEIRHGVAALFQVGQPALQVAQKNLHANLVGHGEFEVRRFRRKVPHQFRLGGRVFVDQRNRPRPLVRSSAPLRRNRPARLNGAPRARLPRQHRSLLRIHLRHGRFRIGAEDRRDVLAKVVIGLVMRGQVAPQVPARRLIHIGNPLLDGITVGDCAFKVVGPLAAAIDSAASSFRDNPIRWPHSTTRARRRKPRPNRRNCPARRTRAPACAGSA